MMQPLSRKRRIGYLLVSFVLFLIMAPVIILYAKGFRITSGFEITKTGGLYISSAYSGVQVFVDETFVKETGIFQKNTLVQNLTPGLYKVRLEKDGLHKWEKELTVFSETVTDAHPFMIPEEIELEEITATIIVNEDENASSSEGVKPEKNPEYDLVVSLFSPKPVATTTEEKILSKLSGEIILGKIHINWSGKEESIPSYFCHGANCKSEIVIATREEVKSFEFLPGRDDLLIISVLSGIYITEIDDRSKQNIQPLIIKQNLELKVDNNTIFIKEDKRYYRLSL